MNDAELEAKYGFLPHPIVLRYAHEHGLNPKWVDALIHDAVVSTVQLENAVAASIDDPTPERIKDAFDELVSFYVNGFDGTGHLDENMPAEGHRLDPQTDQDEEVG